MRTLLSARTPRRRLAPSHLICWSTATCTSAPPGTTTPPSGVTYDIRADIDGHSQLVLSGTSAYWHQIGFAAPGTHNGQDYPTVINGTSWCPAWRRAGQNYSCGCDSNAFQGVSTAVPSNAATTTYKAISCRDSCSATYRSGVLTVDFNDDPTLGDAWYEIQVTVS